jgi:hypothetical protein
MDKPTDLVRDRDTESRDPVPDEQFRVPPVPLGDGPQNVGGLERADDPRSWEPPPAISARAVARRQRRERAAELGPLYWLPLKFGLGRIIGLCVSVAGLLIVDLFGWVGLIAYRVAVAVAAVASQVWAKRRRGEFSGLPRIRKPCSARGRPYRREEDNASQA